MNILVMALLAVCLPVGVAAAWVYGMQQRHLDYLRGELRALGGEDRWDVRCTHCGGRMRDAASIRLSTRAPSGAGWVERTDGAFHTGRPDCADAAERLGASR
ncbi:hypothetical protein [Streptomyces sp. NPDC047868]|uniref:hypothetical protein n=1 Tax=Streptomyces sp. NPDC047868 TaxID=3155480 RepID=UPI003455330C